MTASIRLGYVPARRAPVVKAAAVERGPNTLDFGRYEGWTIEQLAAQDSDYLKWLSRHSSGIRYRQQIEAALQTRTTQRTVSERTRGRRDGSGRRYGPTGQVAFPMV